MGIERLEIISWSEFQEGIAPLWKITDPKTIPIFNNPYNIIQYDKSDWQEKIIYFPAKYFCNDVVVGYTSIYNISDTHIRPRGIYILPEYQGKGLGHRMQQAAWNLFPRTFYRAFIWSRQHNVERFIKHSGMKLVPNVSNVWSEFSQLYMTFLYADRYQKPNKYEIFNNRNFLRRYKKAFSFGGRNNLNISLSDSEWQNYFEEHKGNYTNFEINLDFV